MATVAGDVPGLYDLVVNVSGGNTTGFVFDDALESSLPFRTHKATYTYSPTFIERQNVQGDFGDNQQDFFLTATQKDWGLGEQQRFFRSTDDDAKRRYWQGSAIDVTTTGQVAMRRGIIGPTSAAAAVTAASRGQVTTGNDPLCFTTSTNLYVVNSAGTIADKGAHGLGASPVGLCSDGANLYMSTTSAGTVGVRKYTPGFATFSATGADALCFLNNTLYGYRNTAATGDLIRYDSAGVATSLFTWKGAAGTANPVETRLEAFGGKLLILRFHNASDRGSELWLYDGTAPSKIAEFPMNFYIWDMEVSAGTVFLSGALSRGEAGGTAAVKPCIYYYAGGSLGVLWKADSYTTAWAFAFPGIVSFEGGLVFNDVTQNKLLFYDPASGGIHAIAPLTMSGTSTGLWLVSLANFVGVFQRGDTPTYVFPSGTTASSSTVTTSLFDFESSLKKFFRGITVEFDSATDGNGGTVDVAYRLEDVDGSYTGLATGITSGTETTLSGITGKRISVKVTLNKGTSTNGPVLKRIYVRAAPIQTRFKQREYILSCIGDPASEDRQILRDGMSSHPLTGRAQADQLVLAAASQTPLTITDRFGTYTGIIETLEIYEQHSSNANPSASGTFVVKVVTREI